MPHLEPSLFELDDRPAASTDRSLVIRSRPSRPLGKEERAFNRALARVQTLSRSLDEEKHRLDQLLILHAAEIRPRSARTAGLRTRLALGLVPFLDDRRLTKSQRGVLRRLLVVQLDDVLMHVQQPDPDLQALFERLHDVSYAQAVQNDIREAQADMEDFLDELGLDVEAPDLRVGMTEADAAATAAQFAEALRRAAENRDAATRARPLNKKARAAEARAERHAQLRKDNLGGVYRRLVKEMHPDRESDPVEREKKSRVMQEITGAHARGDLYGLLRLELEWLGGASGDLARLGADKLRAYTELLKEQATELADAVESLPLHPRYADLLVEGPLGLPLIVDGPSEIARLDAIVAQLDAALERLSRDALSEVRSAIREYRDSEKRLMHTGW